MSFMKKLAPCVLLLCIGSAQAAPPASTTGQAELTKSSAYDVDTWIDANSLLMFVTNTGSFAHQAANTFGKSDGLYFPFTSVDDILTSVNDNTVVFAAGPWLGAIDEATGDTLTVIAEFTDEYWPGPMNVIASILGADTAWTFDPNGDVNANYRVYKLYADSLEGNPGGDYADYLAYAVDQGAPVDEFGEPAMLGDQMLWTVFNDANPVAKTNSSSATDPLGIEVQAKAWAHDSEDWEGKVIYLEYIIHNKGARLLRDCYFSMWADPDLGGSSDDLVGCDTLDNVFFCYNATNSDNDYGDKPPAVGFKFLYGPLVEAPGETAVFAGNEVADFKNLGLTSFMKYINGTDPQNYVWTYQYMTGLDAAYGGIPLLNGTKYFAPGDPVTPTGDIDTDPDDCRMMGTCGPFELCPGDSQYVLIRLAVGQGLNRLASINALRDIINRPFDIPVGVNEGGLARLPEGYAVGQNYPNPFNPSTTIKYSLPTRSRVCIDIYNIVGQRVRRLLDESKPAGTHTVVWDGADRNGETVSTGVYFYRVKAGDYLDQKKMLLLK